MVRLGRVALDGAKLRPNASRRKAMSYARMSQKEKLLAQEVSELLAEAEGTDRAEDAAFGKDARGDELPEELRRRESRLARIGAAKKALEEQAAISAEQEAAAKARAAGQNEDSVAEFAAAAGREAVPKPKAQRYFTDPDSKIMKTADGSFHQCFNAQAVVDDEHQVIVAADLNDCGADMANLIPMTEQVQANTGEAPAQMVAGAGYCSNGNPADAAAHTTAHGTELFIAIGRRSHDEPAPAPMAPARGMPQPTKAPRPHWVGRPGNHLRQTHPRPCSLSNGCDDPQNLTGAFAGGHKVAVLVARRGTSRHPTSLPHRDPARHYGPTLLG